MTLVTFVLLLYLNACVYLAQLRRYGASEIMGLRPWPFGVTWRHRSRDDSTPGSTFYGWTIVTMRLSSTVMEIWPFEDLPERLFQEQRSVVGRSSVGRSSILGLHWSYILLFATIVT